jgi:two-component system cell cycle sensor histidine kinase/response regulator CckA
MPQLRGDCEGRPLDGLTVLLAEDEDRLRIIVAMMIEELGAEVIKVSDGKSALEAYGAHKEKIDLVLLDMRMVGLSGVNTFLQLIELNPEVKVVLSSGVAPDDDLVETLVKHKGGFIEKPFNLKQLGDVLSAVFSGRSSIHKL